MDKVEYVDIYDRNKNKTGITKIRNTSLLSDGEYVIGVQLIILNSNNEILITKRSDNKRILPGKWECNGGGIIAGESSIEGLKREISEELGIELDMDKVKFFKTVVKDDRHNIKDIYLYRDDIDVQSLNLPNEEVSMAKYVSIDQYMDMFNAGDIVYNVDFDDSDYKRAIQIYRC